MGVVKNSTETSGTSIHKGVYKNSDGLAHDIRVVFIGNMAMPEKNRVYSLKNYARLFNEMVQHRNVKKLTIFAGYICPGETGFDFSNDESLRQNIQLKLSKGNTPDTDFLRFCWNNLLLFTRLTFFNFKRADYFLFLPAPFGVWSTLILTLFRRYRTLGIYIGGYYGREQAFEKRNGFIKKRIKKLVAVMVDKWVIKAIKKADYVITSSYEYAEIYKDTGKVFLTPPLINVDERDIASSISDRPASVITFCGELRHAKGIFDLVNAFSLLINEKRIPDCQLKIIGDGQALGELKKLVEKNGIKDRVLFEGQIKDANTLKDALRNSTIFVLPSYSEGFPRVAYETFTLGVPAVLTPVGGIPFLLKDNIHCLFAHPGNVADLANKIALLINDRALQTCIAENARALMVESVFPRIKADVSLSEMIMNKMNEVA
ncbi:MAG: glycosyltransferase [Chitinophagaceae bacterium]